jgi:TPR repeat protein
MPSGRLSPGSVVGEWRVEAYLGRGLSAEVYRVVNARFGHAGALKLLVDGTRGLRGRFAAEADALRFLSLPALPRFMGSGEIDGAPYYVMEYLQPLPDPMPRGEVSPFMRRVAKAVQSLHDAGYIHRDLKPGNVLMRENGEPVLIDLGLVKRRGTGVTDPIVRHGRGLSIIDGKPVGVGTLDYAAPEQLLKGESSVQSDVFALGKMLRALYEGDPPSCVKGVVRTATRELPGDRYESADAFASALRRVHVVRCGFAALLLLALAAGAVALNRRAELRKWAIGVLDPPQRVLTVVKAPDEPASAYLARLKKVAEGGSAVAQCALAEAYMYGQGTETNAEEAVRWYRKSAGQGNSDAQSSLGLCRLRGIGCEKDVFEAVRWYTLAAEQKNLSAMNDLAFCKMHGIGIDKDEAGAFALALEAARSGHAPAQAMVGECYLEGMGVERDVAAAETWLYRAARLGNRRAKALLETR